MSRTYRPLLALLLLGAGGACSAPEDQPLPGSLPILHPADEVRARHGEHLLKVDTLSRPAVPRAGIDNLWVVWPDGYSGDYWAAFRARYGMHEAPFDNGGLPMGMRAIGESVTFDCLLCHAGTVAGQTVIGVANSTLDVQGLLDDLERAATLAGITPSVRLRNRTGAAGATDAVGMAFALGEGLYGVPEGTLNSEIGFERAPAWWQLKHKQKAFNDGSTDAPAFRTMAGTLLAFGLNIDQIAARGTEFEDIGHYILTLTAPAWPYGPLDRGRWARGQDVYARDCAACHGVYHGETRSFPDEIVPATQVGTDPVRTVEFRSQEANAINSTWFGQPPVFDTDGYLAPTLVGIWARAPYLHNGSVPDLAGVIDSTSRPVAWKRIGSGKADYDEARVGWRYEASADRGDPTTIEGRRIYDTARPGLSNRGHYYGDTLSEADREALLEYMKSL